MKSAALVALALLALSASAAAQSPAPVNKQPPRTKSPAVAYDAVAEARRSTAISLVTSLADEARSYRDEILRARVQARAADALWETDQERARALFRRAWDAADLGDKELARRTEEDKRRQLATGNSVVLSRPPNLRGEVLRLAAKRDRALGEEFLAKLDDARRQEEADAALKPDAAPQPKPRALSAPEALSFSTNHRLELARQLLQSGDVERALQFAEPALSTVTRDSVLFVTDLRDKSPDRADQIYSAMLARAVADASSDANTVSLLSSYVIAPRYFINILPSGDYGIDQEGDSTPFADLPAALRVAFLQAAASVLLRPPAPLDQDQTSGGRAATYFELARLLPFFEQSLPARAAQLRAQLSALTPDAPEELRDDTSHLLTAGFRRDDSNARDDVQDALDKLRTATTDDERDRLYIQAAMAAVGKHDPRARDFAESVKDADARAQLLAYVDFMEANAAAGKKDVEGILKAARRGAMSHLQKVWALTTAARISAKENRALALDLLEEAAAEARRIDGDDADRPRALLAVLTPLYELDPTRVWSLASELVKTVNAAPEFTGEDGRLVTKFRTKSYASIWGTRVEDFNLQPLFQTLARADFERATELARGFTNDAPRATATLAVATAILDDKGKARKP
ncbi:MAG: hypothetical protein LC746_10025 [Acidobacteria bacterium]|nr:hypothetical protein [Acidobacteriota bacterium]